MCQFGSKVLPLLLHKQNPRTKDGFLIEEMENFMSQQTSICTACINAIVHSYVLKWKGNKIVGE